MADEKLKEEQQVELVEKPAFTDDFENVDAQSSEHLDESSSNVEEKRREDINVDDDASLHAGKVSFAQKVVGDRFEVLAVIGQGGMGSVYKVRDLNTDRIVALKLLKPELCEDKAVLKRFQQEAASLAELDHENIVAVYDHGITSDGAPFLIMQLLEGDTLAGFISKNGKLSPSQAIELTLQICRGLDYAHKKGFVHRDIKPSNIVLLNDGINLTIKLLDFGIAKIIESKSAATTNLTQTGDVFGTPAYMSPEQCQGGDIDSRTDIYSLGCVLYEMLTGKQPFAGTNAIQVALKHINGTPDTFTSKLPDGDVLHSLEEIVLKCMRKESRARFQSVSELEADLNAVKAGRHVGYLEPDEEQAAKQQPSKIMSVAQGIGTLTFYWIVFMLFAITTCVMFYPDPTSITYEPRVPASSPFVVLAVFGLFIHYRAAAKVVSQSKKRKTLLEWMWALLVLLVFAFYVQVGLIATVSPEPISGAFLSIGILFCSFAIWAIVFSGIIIQIGLKAKILFESMLGWVRHKRNPAYVKPKTLRVPMSLSRASVRIAVILTFVLVGYVAAFPATMANFLNRGAYLLYTTTGAELTVPTMRIAQLLDPQNAHTFQALAHYYSGEGDDEQALKMLDQGLAIAPLDQELLQARAEEYVAIRRYKDAITDLENVSLPDMQQRILLGRAYLGSEDLERAYSVFTSAIDDNGHSFGSLEEAYCMRALTAYAQKKYQLAVDDMSKAIEEGSSSDKPLNYVRRGLAFQALGQRTAARKDFETAFRSYHPSTGEDHLAAAFCAIQRGDKANAEIQLQAAQKAGLEKDDLADVLLPDVPLVNIAW